MNNIWHILYHVDCCDGFGAAYVAAKWCEEKGQGYQLIPCTHGGKPPVFPKDTKVLVFDFSWKRLVMEKLLADLPHLHLFDHHVSAQKELEGLGRCTFDMTKSGAQLAWAYFYGDEPEPWWVGYIADWDLWKKELPGCDDVHAWMGSFPKTVEAWDKALDITRSAPSLVNSFSGSELFQAFMANVVFREGRAINRVLDQMIYEHAKKARTYVPVDPNEPLYADPDQNIYWTFCNEPRIFSKLGQKLAADSPSKIGLCVTPEGSYSFRSTDDGPDVSVIAAKFGGGGHRHAAGCGGDPFGLLRAH